METTFFYPVYALTDVPNEEPWLDEDTQFMLGTQLCEDPDSQHPQEVTLNFITDTNLFGATEIWFG